MAFAGQFRTQFTVVVNLAVEKENGIAVRTSERLRSALQINDLQTNRAERHEARLVHGLLIRTAMDQACRKLLNNRRVKRAVAVGIARYTAHSMLFSVCAGAFPGALGLRFENLEALPDRKVATA